MLIAVARGGSEQAARAMQILDDPERQFAASPFLRLEVLPQAIFNNRDAEVAFYEAFFSAVSKRATDLAAITEAPCARPRPAASKPWTPSMWRRPPG